MKVMKMTYLITGANGQLGQDFGIIFNQLNEAIILRDLDLDITDLPELRKFVKQEKLKCIINCAAYNNVDEAETEWKKAFNINGIGTRNLVLIANELDIKFVHYSTDYVFDGEKGNPYFLIDPTNPISKYGESKLLGEKYVTQLGKKFFLIRTSWVFGKGNINFVRKVLDWSKKNIELKIVTDQISCPTYTKDLAMATIDLIKTNAYGCYHITNSSFCSRYEWAKYILEKIGWEGKLNKGLSEDFNTKAKRPKFSVLSNFGLEETIGYELPDWKDATNRFLIELGEI